MRLFRLVLVGSLFVAWLSYLGFLVLTRPLTPEGEPLVLSRPQILASTLDVVAELPAPSDKDFVQVTVEEVLFSRADGPKKGDTITVSKLDLCHPVPRSPDGQAPPDWSGQGRYLLPLKQVPGPPGRYEVAAIPPSPGFTGRDVYRIYPATGEARAQYERIRVSKEAAEAEE
jgi:hypothetical protein